MVRVLPLFSAGIRSCVKNSVKWFATFFERTMNLLHCEKPCATSLLKNSIRNSLSTTLPSADSSNLESAATIAASITTKLTEMSHAWRFSAARMSNFLRSRGVQICSNFSNVTQSFLPARSRCIPLQQSAKCIVIRAVLRKSDSRSAPTSDKSIQAHLTSPASTLILKIATPGLASQIFAASSSKIFIAAMSRSAS